jgi:hypothetical protein
MLIAFIALIALVNGVLGWVNGLPYMGWFPASMQTFSRVHLCTGVVAVGSELEGRGADWESAGDAADP